LKAVENAWLMPVVPHPFNDFVHMAASWIWSSGGHLMDNRGKQVLFNSHLPRWPGSNPSPPVCAMFPKQIIWVRMSA
jgi:hypothetical protein